ncbi:hypothetical protein [Pseudarthrobacter sp. H2]|uniref:hypothetical protein n=1 Tax=Pseudarthrobacter sp. H2 TaxID=3418415 RepID=UPI003CFAE261
MPGRRRAISVHTKAGIQPQMMPQYPADSIADSTLLNSIAARGGGHAARMVPADHSTLLVNDASTTHSHTVMKAGVARAFPAAGRGDAKCRSSTVNPIRVSADNAGTMTGQGITDRQAEAATVSGTTSRAKEMGTMLNQLRMANRAPLNSHPHPAAAAVHALPAVTPTRFPMAASLTGGAWAAGPGCGANRSYGPSRPA